MSDVVIELLWKQARMRRFHVHHDWPRRRDFCDWESLVGIHRGDAHPGALNLVVQDVWKEREIDAHNIIVAVSYVLGPVVTTPDGASDTANMNRLREDGGMSETIAATTQMRLKDADGKEVVLGLCPNTVPAERAFYIRVGGCDHVFPVKWARAMHGMLSIHFGAARPTRRTTEPDFDSKVENPMQTQPAGGGFMVSRSPWRRRLDAVSNALSILVVAGGCGALGYFTEWYAAAAPPVAGVMAWAVAKLIRRRTGFYRMYCTCPNCTKVNNFRFPKRRQFEGSTAACPYCRMPCRVTKRSALELAD